MFSRPIKLAVNLLYSAISVFRKEINRKNVRKINHRISYGQNNIISAFYMRTTSETLLFVYSVSVTHDGFFCYAIQSNILQ